MGKKDAKADLIIQRQIDLLRRALPLLESLAGASRIISYDEEGRMRGKYPPREHLRILLRDIGEEVYK